MYHPLLSAAGFVYFLTCICANHFTQLQAQDVTTASTFSTINDSTISKLDNKTVSLVKSLLQRNLNLNSSDTNSNASLPNLRSSIVSQTEPFARTETCSENDQREICKHTNHTFPSIRESKNSRLQLESAQFISVEKGTLPKPGSTQENGISVIKSNQSETEPKKNTPIFNQTSSEIVIETSQKMIEGGHSTVDSVIKQGLQSNESMSSMSGLRELDTSPSMTQVLNPTGSAMKESLTTSGGDAQGPTSQWNSEQLINGSVFDDKSSARPSFVDIPLLQETLKYIITDYYPKKMLNSISKRSNASSEYLEDAKLTPTVVYPLVMEGISILFNKLTGDENADVGKETGDVVRGKIAQGMMDSINKLFRPKGSSRENSDITASGITEKAIRDGLLNLETFNRVLPIVQTVQGNDDLQNVITGLIGNVSSGSNADDLSELLKNYGSNLAGILNKTQVMSSLNGSDLSKSVNLTNMMEQFMPKFGAGGVTEKDGASPKNPLLRSEFLTKIVSKSPVAHLGALDDSILRLVTSSLERAVTRVRVNEKGEIQMSEGMRKMLLKMIEDRESKRAPGENNSSASDSVYNLLKSAITSKTSSVPYTSLNGGQPTMRRNNTRHSPLHRKFQLKYGKGAAPNLQAWIPSCLIVALTLNLLLTL